MAARLSVVHIFQVFAVRSGGETGVVVKGPTERMAFTFILKDRGPLISIKFSHQHKVLAMQRCDRSVVSAQETEAVQEVVDHELGVDQLISSGILQL